MRLIKFIKRLFRNLWSSLQRKSTQDFLGDVNAQDVINPEQSYDAVQIIVPRIYEFTDEEKISVLRLHDYVHLPQLNSEQIAQERG